MATDYFDFTASVNGTGSINNPYNSVAAINLFNGGGDLGGRIFAIKANGGKERSAISLSNASNFTIETYGTGERPILDGTDIVTPTWVYDDVEALWYYSTTRAHGLYPDGVQLMPMGSFALCRANENTQYWDSTNSRIYVNIGVNPNSVQWEQSNPDGSRSNGIYILTSSSVNIKEMAVRRCASNNIALSAFGDQLLIKDCKIDEAGDWSGTQSMDGIVIYGSVSAGVPSAYATNVLVLDNEINTSRNNAVEMWGVEAGIIHNNSGIYNGGVFELWGYVNNSQFTTNNFTRTGHGRINVSGNSYVLGTNVQQSGFYIAKEGTSGANNQGHCSSNSLIGNVLHSDTGMGAFLDSGQGTVVKNNTLIGTTDTRAGYKFGERGAIYMTSTGATPTDADIENNILCTVKPGWTSRESIVNVDATSVMTGDNNVYYGFDTSDGFGSAVIGVSTYANFAAYQTGVSTVDANSVNSDPLFTDRANYDFTTQVGSPARANGSSKSAGAVRDQAAGGNLFPLDSPDIGGHQQLSQFDPSSITQGAGGW